MVFRFDNWIDFGLEHMVVHIKISIGLGLVLDNISLELVMDRSWYSTLHTDNPTLLLYPFFLNKLRLCSKFSHALNKEYIQSEINCALWCGNIW